MKVAFVYTNGGWLRPHPGITYVMTNTRKKGHDVYLIDPSFERDKKKFVMDSITKIKPDVIAHNTVFYEFEESLENARLIKTNFPKIIQIWGGVYPTLQPTKFLEYPEVDYICVNEGEQTIPDFLDELSIKKKKFVTRGLYYKENGNIVKNLPLPYQNLDSFEMPDWSFWNMNEYFKTSYPFSGGLRILASRGCPHKCSFCVNQVLNEINTGIHYRERNPEKIMEEIEMNYLKFKDMGLKYFYFADETFGTNKKFFFKLMDLMIKSKIHKKIKWACGTRADIITEPWIKKAKDAGCINVNFGIETANQEIRNKKFNKNLTNKDIINAAKLLNKYSIIYTTNIIINPYENIDETRVGIDWVKKLKPFFIHYSPLTALPHVDSFKNKKNPVFIYKKMLPYESSRKVPKEMIIKMNLKFNREILLSSLIKRAINSPIIFLKKLFEFIFNINLSRPSSIKHPSFMLFMTKSLIYDTYFEEKIK